jgi:hypothetical protein
MPPRIAIQRALKAAILLVYGTGRATFRWIPAGFTRASSKAYMDAAEAA